MLWLLNFPASSKALSSPQDLPVNLLLLQGTAFDNLALPQSGFSVYRRIKIRFYQAVKALGLGISSKRVLKLSQRMNPLERRNQRGFERNASESSGLCSFPWIYCAVLWWGQNARSGELSEDETRSMD